MASRPLQWQQVQCRGDLPVGRVGETVTAVEQARAVFMYGGVLEAPDRPSEYLDDFFEFDPDAATWHRRELSSDSPVRDFKPRAFHSTVTYEGRLYVFGGCSTEGKFNDLFCVEPVNATRSKIVAQGGEAPTPRYCHSAVVFQDAMWVFGGKCGSRNSSDRLADIHRFDFLTNTWSIVPQEGDVPPALSAHSAVVCGRRMYVFGGRNGEACCGLMFEFNFDSGVWRRVSVEADMRIERARHSAVVHNGLIAVFGGWNGRRKLNDLYLHAVDGSGRQLLTDEEQGQQELVPSRRECHVAVMWRNTMLVFSGRHRVSALDDVQALRLGPPSLLEMCRDWLALHEVPLDEGSIPERLYSRIAAWKSIHTATNSPLLRQGSSSFELQ